MKDRSFGFRFRAFTTLIVVLGFAALLVSGGVLFLSPPGRVANWTQWQILGLTKHGWSDLHVVFSALFLVAGVVHLAFNWRPLLHHLGARMAGKVGFRPEWVAAILVGLVVFAGTRAKVAPISTLLAWSEQLRNGWEQPRERAPIPHAELLTLGELAKEAGVAPEEALRRLESKGIQGATLDRQVQLIADDARVTPARVYEIIGKRDGPSAAGSEAGHSAKGPGAGGGPGWMTLEKYCVEQQLDLTTVQAALTKRGIRFAADQTLREIAVGNGFDRPYALLEIIRQK
jgi:hypothetical protein